MAAAHQSVNTEIVGSRLAPELWLHVRETLRLSERELHIVQGICAEFEQDDIANVLQISPDVVYRITQRIYVKLRIGSRMELRAKVRSECLAFAADDAPPVALVRAS